jgi:hypothetical protein
MKKDDFGLSALPANHWLTIPVLIDIMTFLSETAGEPDEKSALTFDRAFGILTLLLQNAGSRSPTITKITVDNCRRICYTIARASNRQAGK